MLLLHEQLEALSRVKIYEESFTQLSKIGKGGFATVYRVVHHIDDKEYAVKQIRLKIHEAKDQLQTKYDKIIREAKNLAQVNHPNVIRYYHSWVQVTERKSHIKQAEQKKQAQELASTAFNHKKEEVVAANAKNTAAAAAADLSAAVPPPPTQQQQQVNIPAAHNSLKQSKIAQENSKTQQQTTKSASTVQVNSNRAAIEEPAKEPPRHENEKQKQKKKQQHRKAFIIEQEENEDNQQDEDDDLFDFDSELGNELVFFEEDEEEPGTPDEEEDEQEEGSAAAAEEEGGSAGQSSCNINDSSAHSKQLLSGRNQSMKKQSNITETEDTTSSTEGCQHAFSSQHKRQQQPFNRRLRSETAPASHSHNRPIEEDVLLLLDARLRAIPKRVASEFQLVFESYEESDSKKVSNRQAQQLEDVRRNGHQRCHEEATQTPAAESIHSLLRTQEDPQQGSQHQLPQSQRSFERRKNKSLDHMTIHQKQRQLQLDKFDEIIFYLQTELCATTLAEYIADRNAKIFASMLHQGSQQQPLLSHPSPPSRLPPSLAAPIPNKARPSPVSPSSPPPLDFQDILTTEQKLEAIRILRETIQGLWHIHHVCTMVHLDLKPHNIFLTEDKKVKIGDFGLVKKLSRLTANHPPAVAATVDSTKAAAHVSKAISVAAARKHHGVPLSSAENIQVHDRLPFYLPKEEITSTCGTAAYASPEQMSQKVEFFDHRADIYSLGIIILQLFHPINTTMELVKTIQHCKQGELPRSFCTRFPQLAEIIKDSLSNDPQKRPLLSKIEATLAEMEIAEGSKKWEDLGQLTVTFEGAGEEEEAARQPPTTKFGKVIRNCFYLFKTSVAEKAEYVYNLSECTVQKKTSSPSSPTTSPSESGDSIVISHAIQQNIIIRASSNHTTELIYQILHQKILSSTS